jgi:hypothetical protein
MAVVKQKNSYSLEDRSGDWRQRISCSALIFLVFSSAAFSQADGSAKHSRTLHTQREVFQLSKAEASKAVPIQIEAVVTYSDPEWGILFVQDRTGPTFIDVHGISTKFPIGTRVRVNAVTGINKDGPIVAHPRIVVLGRGAAPICG